MRLREVLTKAVSLPNEAQMLLACSCFPKALHEKLLSTDSTTLNFTSVT